MGAATSVLFLPCEELPQAHLDALESSLDHPGQISDMLPPAGYSKNDRNPMRFLAPIFSDKPISENMWGRVEGQ